MKQKLPANWRQWVERYDRMQETYLLRRSERFDVIVAMVRATQTSPKRIVDLGCGTGTLTQRLLIAFPECQVVGIDIDASLLLLTRARLSDYGSRAIILHRDLRDGSWADDVGESVDAATSSTALHWLAPDQLIEFYGRLSKILKPGGLFINADPVACKHPVVQKAWEVERELGRQTIVDSTADTWSGFFREYAQAVGTDPGTMGDKAVGSWTGVEEGMPLSWHFDQLRKNGFVSPECFWRCNCDAVYGAFRAV